MTFEIQKNIPIPQPAQPYPFGDMEVGDSFDLKNIENPAGARSQISRAKAIFRSAENENFECTTRYYPEQKILRVWRVKDLVLAAVKSRQTD